VIACSCTAVREHTVRVAVAAGARSVEEIGERCGAGTTCGGCHVLLEEILAEQAVVVTAAHHAA
jgi:bacterioferritin-associated ferredoxin